MKTNTPSSIAAQNEEVTLGWTSMPAYGEVMSSLIGTSHTDVVRSVKLTKPSSVSTFWSMLSNLRHPDLGVKEPGMRQRSWEND